MVLVRGGWWAKLCSLQLAAGSLCPVVCVCVPKLFRQRHWEVVLLVWCVCVCVCACARAPFWRVLVGVGFRTTFQHTPANSRKCSNLPVFGASTNLPEFLLGGVGFWLGFVLVGDVLLSCCLSS